MIRLVLENEKRFELHGAFAHASKRIRADSAAAEEVYQQAVAGASSLDAAVSAGARVMFAADLLSFIHERLKVYLRERARGMISSISNGQREAHTNDDLLMIVRRVEALGSFLDTDDGRNLLAGYKRAANIVRAEEKKEKGTDFSGAYDPRCSRSTKKRRSPAPCRPRNAAAAAIAREDFAAAMAALSHLRAPVDTFFEKVTVNDADPAKRLNRLRLLNACAAPSTRSRTSRRSADSGVRAAGNHAQSDP